MVSRGHEMKLETEIPDDILAAVMQSAALNAAQEHIQRKLGSWSTENEVKREIDARWSETVGKIIQEEMADLPALREKVRAALDRKLSAQLAKAIKESEK